MGLLSARFLAGRLAGLPLSPPPPESMMGSLYQHVTRPREPGQPFEPMNVNLGLLPPLPGSANKKDRRRLHAERACQAFADWHG